MSPARRGTIRKRMPAGTHRRDLWTPREWRIEGCVLTALVSAACDSDLGARVGVRVHVVGDIERSCGTVIDRRDTRGGALLTIELDAAPLIDAQDLRLGKAMG